jgi:transcriptional regulator with XRE-family HTH domain
LLRILVGDALRRIRLDQGRTLAEVAAAARVSLPYLSELERGRKEASSEVLAAICDALRVDLPELLAEIASAEIASAQIASAEIASAQIIRLDSVGHEPAAPVLPASPGDAVCLLAA